VEVHGVMAPDGELEVGAPSAVGGGSHGELDRRTHDP
jgi:hypothetical protein